MTLNEQQMKHLVDRFLAAEGAPKFFPMPSGTNLLDARQATEMVRYVIEGMPE